MKTPKPIKFPFKFLFLFRRYILIPIFLFQTLNCLSQNKDIYGSVYYTNSSNPNEVLNSEKTKQSVKAHFNRINEYMIDVKFKLEFFNQTSSFTVSNKLDNGLKPKGGLFADKLISNGSYYSDLNKNLQLRKVDEEILVKSQPSKLKWTLTQETKKINNYLCYKAISSATNKNSSGEYSFEIIAWYAPKIPVSFGPKQFIGLPGLILELKDTHYTFYAAEIELFPKEKPVIKIFKGKIITEEKYRERIREMMGGFIPSKN